MANASWESYARSHRIPSERQRIRRRKKGQLQQQLHLYKELRLLEQQQHDCGFAELSPPVQRGWKRYFVMRPDLLLSKDADFYLQLLEKINTTTYSHRKDFKHKKRRRGKRVYVPREQHLREFYSYDWYRQKFTEREMNCFKQVPEFIGRSTRVQIKYVFTEPWRFVLRVRPNMITHVKIINPQLMSRITEIDHYFERNNLYPRVHRAMHGTGRWYSYKDKSWKGHRHREKKEFYTLLKNLELL